MTRRFEFIEGNSAKYWEVSRHEKSVTVHFGRIGTPGNMLVKDFPSEDAARKHTEKLVAQKAKKGYQECVAK